MKCTVCQQGSLNPHNLPNGLPCQRCDHCAGHWIKLDDYLVWQQQQEPMQAVVEDIEVEVDAVETSHALLCPESGSRMTKFRIGSDTDHWLHWSAAAGAIWLDKGEWELLVQKGVADKLNQIFTEQRQQEIRQQTQRNSREHRLVEQLGDENYSRLKLVRSWLHEQPAEHRAIMIAFLVAKDPFRQD